MKKQYPKAAVKEYWLHRVNPLDTLLPQNVGGSDDINYAIRRCKELAEADKGKSLIVSYRVLKHRGEVVFLSHVNFDEVTHFDMREESSNGKQEENQ